MSKEPLIENKSDTTQNIRNLNYGMILLILIACGYSVLFVTMAININSMTNNLEKIIHFMDTIQQGQVNATLIDSMRTTMNLMKDCVLHKYCKRVPGS